MDFRILGPLAVDDLALGGARQRAVLAVLLVHANEAVSADRLVGALWGEDAPPTAVKSLQVAVSRLRRELGAGDVVETTASGYRVRVGPGELDLDRFEGAAAAGRESLAAAVPARAAEQLREALDEWRGPALADLAALPFAAAEIARLEEQRLEVLEARVEADLAVGRHAELVGELRALVAEHPWRERLHAHLMLALYRTGRQADALDAYAAARAALVEQLGIEPGPELRSRQAAILAHDPALAPPGTARATALPRPPDLFGREADLARVCDQVRSARLVTLVGPGGVGKTSLALAAAHQLQGEFADGATFAALAAIADSGELEGAIARALAVPQEAALRTFLADRELLLVLDNFEQLVVGAPLVAELLADAPRLTALVTSREATRLGAERVYPVAPLAGDDAVELFADRVRAHKPDFGLDDAAADVRAICERLDGLPLAVELAAARVGLLSPAELAARLDHALPLLAGGPRDAPERQQTLRATIDWSYGLLTEAEREAFARFAVFAGGATVQAAEEVTGGSLDTLQSLVAKQLLRRSEDRLVMLALVREYALERLADDDPVHDRLAAWCIAVAESEAPRMPNFPEVRKRLDSDLPNAVAALRTALARGTNDTAADLAIAWGTYWRETGRRSDEIHWVDTALERTTDARRLARLRLTRAALITVRAGPQFRADLEEALEYFRSAGDAAGIAACLGHLAFGNVWLEEYETASRLADEAVRFAEQTGDDDVLSRALLVQAIVGQGYDDMASRARRALVLLRALGDVNEIARLCSTTGFVAISERRESEALAWLEEGVQAARTTSSEELPFVLGNAGLAKALLGDLDDAEAALVESIALHVWSADAPLIDEPLLALAAVHAQRGDLERAALLAAVAESHQSEGRHEDELRVWRRLNDEFLAPVQEQLGPDAWERARQRGAVVSLRGVLDVIQRRESVAAS